MLDISQLTQQSMRHLPTVEELASRPEENRLPQPNKQWRDRWDAFQGTGLKRHVSRLDFERRRGQAAKLGFQSVVLADVAEAIMGSRPTGFNFDEGQTCEYFWSHREMAEIVEKVVQTRIFFRETTSGTWPFRRKNMVWRCRLGQLDYLRAEPPRGPVMLMTQLRVLQLFNQFSVLAPTDAYIDGDPSTGVDRIMLAVLQENSSGDDPGEQEFFFLAKW